MLVLIISILKETFQPVFLLPKEKVNWCLVVIIFNKNKGHTSKYDLSKLFL